MAIHPSAIIHPGAEIDASADVGPFCVVGPRVRIGAGTRLISHVSVMGETTLGTNNTVHPFASLGGAPQDLKFKGEPARLVVGNDNTFREGVTLNIGTAGGHMETRVGSNCLFMAYSHVAHDCIVGDRVVVANSGALAGHVTLGDGVIMGGMAGVHQFTRVGRNAFIGGGAMVAQDVPPFCIAQGDRAKLGGLNVIGLKRQGWTKPQIQAIRAAFLTIFVPKTTRANGLAEVEATLAPQHALVAEFCKFIREAKRGVCSARVGAKDDSDGVD